MAAMLVDLECWIPSRLLMKGGEDGQVVLLGNPASSLLDKAVHYDDSSLQMPPKEKLSDADIAVIDKWIKESQAVLQTADPLPVESASITPQRSVVASASAPTISRPVAEMVALSTEPPTPEQVASQDDYFETQIRPTLVQNCYSCHGTAAKGGLRLDSREGLMQGGKDGPVVVAGHTESSMLVRAVHYTDPTLQMPPRKALTQEQVASIDQWIKMGMLRPKDDKPTSTMTITAEQRDFWSYKPPVRPAVPEVHTKWAETDIDRFIWAKLQEKKLKVGGDADKHTLLRRVTYDLTGLPPTPKEVADFNADKSPQAYEHVVDRLLARLLMANAGDVSGWISCDTRIPGNGRRLPIPQVAKYRDYVIAAFNEDKPYDRIYQGADRG